MTKQVMELNKTVQGIEREVDTIKKTQSDAMLEIENVEKKSGTIDARISNRIQEMEERILRRRRFYREHRIHTLGREIWRGKLKKVENFGMSAVGHGIWQEN